MSSAQSVSASKSAPYFIYLISFLCGFPLSEKARPKTKSFLTEPKLLFAS